MHRAVLLAQGNEIGTSGVLSGGGQDEVASVVATAAATVHENGAEPNWQTVRTPQRFGWTDRR